MLSTRQIVTVVVVVVLLVSITLGAGYARRASQAEGQLSAALTQVRDAQLDAATAQMTAHQLADSAAIAAHTAEQLKMHADSSRMVEIALRERLRLSEKQVPISDTACAPVIAAANAALSQADSTQRTLQNALTSAQVALSDYKTAYDTSKASLTRMRAVTGTLAVAATAVGRPSLLQRILPHPGVGVAFGVDQLGAPHLIAGVTFGWHF